MVAAAVHPEPSHLSDALCRSEDAQIPRFINADLIAAGLSPFAPAEAAVKAGRLMLDEIDEEVDHGQSFAFETTLAGIGYRRRIRSWRKSGYHLSLFFLSLPNVETAIARVATRVRQGGHDIPETVDISKASNPDLRASLAALRRAAALARKMAIQTETDLIVVREGRTVRISPETLRREAKVEQDSSR